jgi:phosphoglycolate phosphatase-like HAD superfamily hydrolase
MPSLPKMVAFDLDGVLIDTSRGKNTYRAARFRCPTEAETIYETGGYVYLDEAIEHAVEIVRAFENRGVTIAYVTARRYTAFDKTVQRLTELGFPVDEEFLFMKPHKGGSKPEYKRNILRSLMTTFDIQCFVDDKPENAQIADDLGIPTYEGVCRELAQLAGTTFGGTPP